MSTWTIDILGAAEKNGVVTGTAANEAAAASQAVDALTSALVCHAELGQRRYTISIDDNLLAILVTGRDHHGSSLECLDALTATIRHSTLIS
jgi:CHASE3 domain sensor protein